MQASPLLDKLHDVPVQILACDLLYSIVFAFGQILDQVDLVSLCPSFM